MKRRHFLSSLLVAGVSMATVGCASLDEPLHVYYNAKIYTADKAKPEATAIVVSGGEIVYVGDDNGAKDFVGDNKAVFYDMHSRRMLPGFMDTHCHYIFVSVVMTDTPSLEIAEDWSHEEILEAVHEFSRENEKSKVPIIIGLGYGVGAKPLASELDKVSDRPVALTDSGGHSMWLNTAAMKAAGIDANTPDPIPGSSFFARDEHGNPTGQVVEVNAIVSVYKKLKLGSVKAMKKNLPEFHKVINSNGYTAVYDAGFLVMDEKEILPVLNKTKLPLRYFTSFYYDGTAKPEDFIEMMKDVRDEQTSDNVRPTTLKMFKDGTVEVYSAYMFDDYLPPGHGHGEEVLRNSNMLDMARAATDEDFNVHVHAIGDRAISDVLDIYKELGDISGTKTMAHVQILPPDGLKRFSEQNDVFYQTTPLWLAYDPFTPQVLGDDRYSRMMPLKSVAEGGTTLTFGSDAPVSRGLVGMNPFNNIYYAVCRTIESDDLIIPPQSEGIDVKTAIDAYTINGAKQVGAEDEFGSITVGKSADFIIIDRDILSIPPRHIKDVKVLKTFFRGNCVYDRKNSKQQSV